MRQRGRAVVPRSMLDGEGFHFNGLAPAIYIRLLMIGYFEGIDSERGIAWRLADSLALRRLAGFAITDGA